MKKKILAHTVGLALAMTAASSASAVYPPIVVDGEIVLNYDMTLDMTGTVNIPEHTLVPDTATISINQNNHDSPVTAVGNVINNTPSGVDGQTITDLQVNVSAIGNNASIELDKSAVIGAIQGNQNGGARAVGSISGNRVDLEDIEVDGETVAGIVELNVTAVGNNLTLEKLCDPCISATVGTMQFNHDSPVTATGSIVNNGFGVDPTAPPAPVVTPPRGRDPKLVVSALGNNFSSFAATTGSITQQNIGSPITATGLITRNLGFIGPVSLDVTAVGSNISISAGDDK